MTFQFPSSKYLQITPQDHMVRCVIVIAHSMVQVSVLVKVSIALPKHNKRKELWKERFCFNLVSPHSPVLRKIRAGNHTGQNLKAGADAQVWKNSVH